MEYLLGESIYAEYARVRLFVTQQEDHAFIRIYDKVTKAWVWECSVPTVDEGQDLALEAARNYLANLGTTETQIVEHRPTWSKSGDNL